ncbi:MAG: hypothetical protein KDA93_01580 [Planctomycetaceae bacterium]|nr:hypothetical protein [Planctomycetaceae bacterium]
MMKVTQDTRLSVSRPADWKRSRLIESTQFRVPDESPDLRRTFRTQFVFRTSRALFSLRRAESGHPLLQGDIAIGCDGGQE